MEPAIASLLSLSLAACIITSGFFLARAIPKMRRNSWHDPNHLIYEVSFPPELPAEQVQKWLGAIHGTMPYHVVFEQVATQHDLRYFLRVSWAHAPYVEPQLRALLSDVQVEHVEGYHLPEVRRLQEMGESQPARSLYVPDVESTARTVIGSLQGLEDGESITIQLVAMPARPRDVPVEAPQPLKTGNVLVDAAIRRMGPSKAAHTELVERNKYRQMHALLRIAANAESDARADQLIGHVQQALASTHGNGNYFTTITTQMWGQHALRPGERLAYGAPIEPWPAQFTISELSALIGWPLGAMHVPGVKRSTTRHMWPDALIPTEGIVLAHSTVPAAQPRPIALGVADFMRHTHVIGKTGVGKSALLENIAAQVMDDPDKPTLILFDPHGDLAEAALNHVPRARVQDVIYLNPVDTDSPVGLNLLNGASPSLVTSFLMGVLTSLYGVGPQTSELLRNTIRMVAEHGGMTLYEVALALVDADFRAEVMRSLKDDMLAAWWRGWNQKSDRDKRSEAEPVLRRIGPLLDPEFRGIFGQANGVDIKQVLDEGKIFIVNMSAGLVGEDRSALLGSLVMARIWQETQHRFAQPAEERHPVVMLADEFQRFMHFPNSFGDVLMEARKLNLGLVLAHQLMDQIKEIRHDVQGTRNKFVFQTVAEDAALLAREIGCKAEDIQRLGRHQAIISLSPDNQAPRPATGYTLPPPRPKGTAQRVKIVSRNTYGKPMMDVNAEIAARRVQRAAPRRKRPTIGREDV